MFNFRETKFVPGFRVREPKEEVPGFRLAPDGSIRQSPEDVDFLTNRGVGLESWSPPWPASKAEPATNLAFLGSGAAGRAGDLTPGSGDFDTVAAGDLKCQRCAGGGDFGTTGAYRIEDRVLCQKCAVKSLGIGNEPSSTQPELLRPWLIRPR